ncbi:hypothetical protein F4604DRAFT_274106 [Suillus subluteus]|nr:hypothetical protein F4604DRAFT_274106 [Suillus subluteus]
MIVTSSSFYDPAQASAFTAQQPTIDVWDTQFTGPGGEYFSRQHTTYQQPYRFEGAGTNQYSFPQDQVQQQQQHSQARPVAPATRRSARGSARSSGYYRQGGTQSQQYSQVPPSVPPNPPSAQPPPQPSQQPTGQSLAAQRTTQLISAQFSPVQAEHQYPAQQPQPHFSPPPPPTQSQFQIQQTQFPPTSQFSQNQAQARPHSQFSQPHHPHVPTQSHAPTHAPTQSHVHPHVPTHAQSQPQVHTPPNPPQQSQHYPGPSDPYYLQGDMYYAMNTQGSQSTPSLAQSTASLVGVINACLFILDMGLDGVFKHPCRDVIFSLCFVPHSLLLFWDMSGCLFCPRRIRGYMRPCRDKFSFLRLGASFSSSAIPRHWSVCYMCHPMFLPLFVLVLVLESR